MKNKIDICQICLRTSRTLKVVDRRLSELHDELCEFNLDIINPQYCAECEHLLRKMYSFKAKCQMANNVFKKWMKSQSDDKEPLENLCTMLPQTKIGRWTSHNNLICSFIQEEPWPGLSRTSGDDIKIEIEPELESQDVADVVTLSSEDSTDVSKSPGLDNTKKLDTINDKLREHNKEKYNDSTENTIDQNIHENSLWDSFIDELKNITNDGQKNDKDRSIDNDSAEVISKDSSTQTEIKNTISKRRKNGITTEKDITSDLAHNIVNKENEISTKEDITTDSVNKNSDIRSVKNETSTNDCINKNVIDKDDVDKCEKNNITIKEYTSDSVNKSNAIKLEANEISTNEYIDRDAVNTDNVDKCEETEITAKKDTSDMNKTNAFELKVSEISTNEDIITDSVNTNNVGERNTIDIFINEEITDSKNKNSVGKHKNNEISTKEDLTTDSTNDIIKRRKLTISDEPPNKDSLR